MEKRVRVSEREILEQAAAILRNKGSRFKWTAIDAAAAITNHGDLFQSSVLVKIEESKKPLAKKPKKI